MPPFLDTAPTENMSTLGNARPAAFWCHATRGEAERALTCWFGEGRGREGCCWLRGFPWFVVDGEGGGVVDFVGGFDVARSWLEGLFEVGLVVLGGGVAESPCGGEELGE